MNSHSDKLKLKYASEYIVFAILMRKIFYSFSVKYNEEFY
jgi:hypothetical protein